MSEPDSILKARQIKSLHEAEWMELKEVVAVGIGIADDNPCIIISVKKITDSLTQSVPSEINRVPIKIEETGEISAS